MEDGVGLGFYFFSFYYIILQIDYYVYNLKPSHKRDVVKVSNMVHISQLENVNEYDDIKKKLN